jgi:5'-nucleotidase
MFLRIVITFFLLVCVPCLARAAGPRTLVFVATADQHGHLEQAPRFAHLVEGLRAQNPGRLLLLDGGDLFQGTLASNLHEGAAMVRALNALGYTAAAVGNHEFDFGPAGPHVTPTEPGEDPRGALKQRLGEARFPILSANILDAASGRPLAPAWTVVTIDKVKVGIVGGTTEELPRTTNRKNLVGLRIEPLAPAVSRAAAEARAAGATVVVAVVHAGGNCARAGTISDNAPGDLGGCELNAEIFRLARELRAAADAGKGGRVDAIFGGHTHQGVTAVVAGIPVLQAYDNLRAFSQLDLEVDEHGRPTGHFVAHSPARVPAETPSDARVAAAVAPSLTEVAELRARPLGVTLAEPLRRAYRAESALGNFVADVIRGATAADVGLTNGGGLRADLPAGELTYGALFEALPFDNRLATMTLTGAELRELLRRNLGHDKGILSVAGVTVKARCEGPALRVDLLRPDGSVVADTARLKVGTTDFLANGGDDFGPTMAERQPLFLEGPPVRDVVVEVLKERIAAGQPQLGPGGFFDPAHPRLTLPAPKPIFCRVPR